MGKGLASRNVCIGLSTGLTALSGECIRFSGDLLGLNLHSCRRCSSPIYTYIYTPERGPR